MGHDRSMAVSPRSPAASSSSPTPASSRSMWSAPPRSSPGHRRWPRPRRAAPPTTSRWSRRRRSRSSPATAPTGSLPARTTASVRGPIDTLIVAGGWGVYEQVSNRSLIRWVRSAARRSRRVTSVCSGSFLLAEAGLLEGKRATTHWSSCAELARRHPEIDVDPEPIFVHDGDVWTSAGVTAGMDLSLALVEADLGPEVAVDVARWLVLFLQRRGGQAQFSTQLRAQAAQRDPSASCSSGWRTTSDEDLRVESLAERAAMSPGTSPVPSATRPAAHRRPTSPTSGSSGRASFSRTEPSRSTRSPAAAGSERPRPCAARSRGGSGSPRPNTGPASGGSPETA